MISRLIWLPLACLSLCQCAKDRIHSIAVSVPDQKMAVYKQGQLIREYPISTSKFALSDEPGSKGTPLGRMEIAKKFGSGLPSGAVLKDRKWTGEVLPPNSPGRDPIVSRILWLKGLEGHNANAYRRYIYIHGTAEESRLGSPASYGCVRMSSRDVIELFEIVGVGAAVEIRNLSLRAGAPMAPMALVKPAPMAHSLAGAEIIPPSADAAAVLPQRIPPPPIPREPELSWTPPGSHDALAMNP